MISLHAYNGFIKIDATLRVRLQNSGNEIKQRPGVNIRHERIITLCFVSHCKHPETIKEISVRLYRWLEVLKRTGWSKENDIPEFKIRWDRFVPARLHFPDVGEQVIDKNGSSTMAY